MTRYFQADLYSTLVKERNDLAQETGYTPHSIASNKVLLDMAKIRYKQNQVQIKSGTNKVRYKQNQVKTKSSRNFVRTLFKCNFVRLTKM